MKPEVLIDGYNLLHKVGAGGTRPGPGNLERARAALLAWVAHHVDDPSHVTVVFDSRGGNGKRHEAEQRIVVGLTVLFATGYPNADALIAEICRHHPHPRQLVVVSDDREVQRAARRSRAKAVGCADFTQRITKPRSSHAEPTPPEKPADVSDAERRYWLDVFSKDAETPATPGSKEVTEFASASPDRLPKNDDALPACDSNGLDKSASTNKPRPPSGDEFDYWVRVFEARVRSLENLDDFYRDMLSDDRDSGLENK